MLFNEFLETTLTGGLTPTDKLKQDLSTFKTVFNYATKTDVLYNNLIDNIVNLLKIKFGSYQIIYNSVDVMYRELLITLNPQIPQFLMIQKKQLIENLNTFGDLSNWGDILKDNVSRELNLQERGENSSGYVPIDGNNKDPYSTNDISKNNITNENTDVSRLATDYLNFYAKLTWSVADIELNYIYESYIHLFKIYYDFNDSVSGTSGNNSLEYQVDKNTAAIEMLSNEIDTTNTNVSTNTTKISELSNDKADKTQLDNYYTKTQSESKFAFKGDISNLQGQINTTNNNVATNTRNITTMNSTLQTNSTNIVNLQNVKADKTQLEVVDNKVDGVISGLQNGNIINYEGNYSSTKTYHLAQAITYNGDWFVSNIDNNVGHTPNKSNTNYWVYISAPNVDLAQYLTKSEASSTYQSQSDANNNYNQTINTLNNLDNRLTSATNSINNLQSTKADRSYVDNLITFSTTYRLWNRITWLNTKSENSRNWRWVGRLDNRIIPQNLINIEFDLRNRDFTQTGQWYELIKFGWYKAGSDTIIWIESPESTQDDFSLITGDTYIRFVSKR